MPLKLDCFGMTHQGLDRSTNEDQFLIADLSRSMHVHFSSLSIDDGERLNGATQGQILIVADGLGGPAGGERASRVAIDTMVEYLTDVLPWCFHPEQKPPEEVDQELQTALDRCQEAIERESSLMHDPLATTFTMAWITRLDLHLIHLGNSRAYLHRQHRLRRLTADSQRQESEPGRSYRRLRLHPLWNCLGGPEMEPELYHETLQPHDILLLCTDGLTADVLEMEIAECLDKDMTAAKACHQLVEAAVNHGARDNTTAVIARIVDSIEMSAVSDAEAIAEPVESALENNADVAPVLESELMATI